MSCRVGPVILCYGASASANVARLVGELTRDGCEAACITVVHNPSAFSRELPDPPAGVTVINAEQNHAYAGGMNLGIRDQAAKGREFILLITEDVHLEPGALTRLVAGADAAPAYGILGPRLRWEGQETILNFGGTWNSTGAGRLLSEQPPDPDHDGITVCDYVDGAVVMMRAKVVEAVGLMTERFFMYYEETEYCLRAKRAGWQVGVVLAAEAAQSSGEIRRPGAFAYLMARNGLEFSRLVGGRRAVVAAIGRDIAQSYRLAKMRFSPKSDRARQRFATASLAAMWRGVFAYLRGRWGPPPTNLPGLGDMSSK